MPPRSHNRLRSEWGRLCLPPLRTWKEPNNFIGRILNPLGVLLVLTQTAIEAENLAVFVLNLQVPGHCSNLLGSDELGECLQAHIHGILITVGVIAGFVILSVRIHAID